MPSSSKVSVATPSAPVVAPLHAGVRRGRAVRVSVTVTFTGCPTVAVPGPASRRTALFEKASKA